MALRIFLHRWCPFKFCTDGFVRHVRMHTSPWHIETRGGRGDVFLFTAKAKHPPHDMAQVRDQWTQCNSSLLWFKVLESAWSGQELLSAHTHENKELDSTDQCLHCKAAVPFCSLAAIAACSSVRNCRVRGYIHQGDSWSIPSMMRICSTRRTMSSPNLPPHETFVASRRANTNPEYVSRPLKRWIALIGCKTLVV
jgi:hypothetical protein